MSNSVDPQEQRRHLHSSIREGFKAQQQDNVVVIDDDNLESDNEGFVGTDNQILDFFGLHELVEDDQPDPVIEPPRPQTASKASTSRGRKPILPRSFPVELPWVEIEEAPLGVSHIRAGKSVELTPSADDHLRPHFLAVRRIAQHVETGQVLLYGLPIKRNKDSQGMLRRSLNETYMTLQAEDDDPRPLYEQAMVQYDLQEVTKIRQIKFTDEAFPALSFRSQTYLSSKMPEAEYEIQREIVKTSSVLVCRYALILRYKNAQARKEKKRPAGELRRIYEGEDPTKDAAPRTKKTPPRATPAFSRPVKRPIHSYSSGFCGCGGDAYGAHLAGFRINAGWDKDETVAATFQLNLPQALAYVKSATDMINLADGALPFSTVWHLSCPCQTWSPAHPRKGRLDTEKDVENASALFSVEHFLDRAKPTIATFEQTSGLVSHHPEFFSAFINQIISSGYNVRWKVVNFLDYGNPSSRKRLIVFAARVGHPLPEFPEATHGTEHGLLPYVTIQAAISRVPAMMDWHLDSIQNFSESKAAYDANQFAPCVTTRSAKNSKTQPWHPSGLRPWTVREYAALNSFPPNFNFPPASEVTASKLLHQIGNAVPPLVWQQFMTKVNKCLIDFQDGKIDEAGNVVVLQDLPNAVNSATRRMSRLSVEPFAGSSAKTARSERRTQSVTLSPEPPSMGFATRASTPGDRRLRFDTPPGAKQKRKRQQFVDLLDDEQMLERAFPKKKTKESNVVDLTKEG